jgi:hypothetical protein
MARRRYPRAKVGDTFGTARVVALLRRDSTSNERVRVRCIHGSERDVYVFNLRKNPRCRCKTGAVDAAVESLVAIGTPLLVAQERVDRILRSHRAPGVPLRS